MFVQERPTGHLVLDQWQNTHNDVCHASPEFVTTIVHHHRPTHRRRRHRRRRLRRPPPLLHLLRHAGQELIHGQRVQRRKCNPTRL